MSATFSKGRCVQWEREYPPEIIRWMQEVPEDEIRRVWFDQSEFKWIREIEKREVK